MDRHEIGTRGEAAAAAYLERIGLTVIERNWRCARGEVDIIALDGDTIVLCEVKTRTTVSRGTPEDAVSPAKQQKIIRSAETYLLTSGAAPCPVRFDVIAIRVLSEDRALLRHHRAAFIVE